MLKTILKSCAAVAMAVSIVGCASQGVAQPKGPPQPSLWVVKDADSTIYLYGTIHLRREGGDWGGPAAKAALAEAQEVWTELEIDPAKDAAMQGLVAQLGLDPTRKLSDVIDPSKKPAFEKAVAALGIPAANFDVMRPWLAGLTISILPLLQAGYDPQKGVDQQVDRTAEAAGKTMRWFETAEEQLRFLSGVSEPVALQMLYEAIGEFEQGPEMIRQMEAAWETGNDAELKRLVVDEMKTQYPEVYDALLTQRNRRWADVLQKELAGSGVDFVAVGAGHLLGDDSVQAFLAKKGIRAQQIAP